MQTLAKRWLYWVAAVASALGWQAIAATPSEAQQLARECPDGQRSLFYARVSTETDPLLIRSAPNGRIIGAVPKGWLVVIGERDPSGRWARIGNSWSHWDSHLVAGPTAGAPDFVVGWVSTDYLVNLGEFCEKPAQVSQVQPWSTALGQQALLVQEDWLALGDRLAQGLS